MGVVPLKTGPQTPTDNPVISKVSIVPLCPNKLQAESKQNNWFLIHSSRFYKRHIYIYIYIYMFSPGPSKGLLPTLWSDREETVITLSRHLLDVQPATK